MSSSRRRQQQESQARRNFTRAWNEARVAQNNGDWLLVADKLLQATRAAPSKDYKMRYGAFLGYLMGLKICLHDGIEVAEEEMKMLKQMSFDESEPILIRVEILFHFITTRMAQSRDQEAIYCRRALKLIARVPSEERTRQYPLFFVPPSLPDITFPSGELNVIAPFLIDKLESSSNPNRVSLSTLESVPKINDGRPDPSIVRRLIVGGDVCDCCGKGQAYAMEDELFMRCSLCKKAYYCSPDCQERQWNAGHKNACRELNEIQAGDIMLLDGLQTNPELNNKLVSITGPADAPSRWEVSLLVSLQGRSSTMSVSQENLVHIRPAV